MPNRVLFIIAVLLGGLALQGCGATYEEQAQRFLERADLRQRVADQQARERIADLERQTLIAQAERQHLRALGCEPGEQRQSGSVAVARGGNIDTTRVSMCGTQQVMQYLDSLVRQSIQPQHTPHVSYGAGREIPYARDNGSRPPGWYWRGGSYRQPGTYGNSCWNGHQWLHGPCLFLR